MPRSALSSNGSETFRRVLSEEASLMDITLLQNSGRWVFDIHPQYTIALICLSRSNKSREGIYLKGPYNSLERFRTGLLKEYSPISLEELKEWNEDLSFPLLPYPECLTVFRQLRKSPWLTSTDGVWRVKPRVELHATAQKHMMDLK